MLWLDQIFGLLKAYGAVLTPIAGAIGAIVGYGLRYVGEKNRERRVWAGVRRRLAANLRNIERHYSITATELAGLELRDVPAARFLLQKQKVGDAHLLRFGEADWQYYSDDLSYRVLRLAMLVRNNDLHIDFLASLLEGDVERSEVEKQTLLKRMRNAEAMCAEVREVAGISPGKPIRSHLAP
jgi:hypothetical protein